MSRINAVWSSSDQWTDAVPDVLKQPMTIAFGGAILAHVIFFLALPVVAGKENQPNTVDTPVVQLTPQDLSQIPPDVTQPKIPTGTLLPSSTGLVTPSILSPSLISPSMPSPDSGPTLPLGINFGLSSDSSFPSGVYSDAGLSLNRGNSSSLESEKKQSQAEADKKAVNKKAADQKVADDGKSNKPVDPLPPTGQVSPDEKVGQTTAPIAIKPTTPSPAPTPSKNNAELIAANPSLYAFDVTKQTGPKIGVGIQQAIGDWYNKPDSKEKEIYSSSQKPPEAFQLDTPTKTLPYPTQVNKQPVAVIPDYAQRVKEGKETNGRAIVGITLNGQGEFVSEPSIIQSTGYSVLDTYAIEYVKSRKFRVTGRNGLYVMVIPIAPPIAQPAAPAPAS